LLQAIGRGLDVWEGRGTILAFQRAAQQIVAGWQQWQDIVADAVTNIAQIAESMNALVAPVIDAIGQLPLNFAENVRVPIGLQSVNAPIQSSRIAAAPAALRAVTAKVDHPDIHDASADGGAGSRAYVTFKNLGTWLQATDDEIADAVGVGRTTPYAWQRERRTPTPRTLRRLYQMSSALSAVFQHLGDEKASMWLYENGARRRKLILAGELGELDADIDRVVFAGAPARVVPGTWIPDDRASDTVE
jgi:hypothetical protein